MLFETCTPAASEAADLSGAASVTKRGSWRRPIAIGSVQAMHPASARWYPLAAAS